MKSSRAITLTLLSATMLSACCCALPTMRSRHRDMTWYNANHQPISEQWRTNPDGTRDPEVTPYDARGRPWTKDADGEWRPQETYAGHSTSTTHRRTSIWPLFLGSGYRSSATGSSTSGATSYHSTGGSSISRGGLGSIGAGHSSGS